MLKLQLMYFFNALTFYTRIPAPSWVVFNDDYLNRGSRYFSFVGWFIAGLTFAVIYLSSMVLPISISILLGMTASLLATGAFHEDGFADLCDGFGGGWTTEDILRIMKDSRLGTYGVAGLSAMLALKYASLISLPLKDLFWALLAAHGLSRAWSISLIAVLPYVQLDRQSKAKPVARTLNSSDLAICWTFALLPLLMLGWQQALAVILVGTLAFMYIKRWFWRRLQGYTGDALGASQQIQEILTYVVLLAIHGWLTI